MLVAQATECSRYPNGMPSSNGFADTVVDDALLEASLVHLHGRLPGQPRHTPRGLARDPMGPGLVVVSRQWLARDVRRRINAQVAHLSTSRDEWFAGDIRTYMLALCVEFDDFVGAVEDYRHDRVRALGVARRCVQQALQELSALDLG